MRRFFALVVLLVGSMALTTVAAADDVADIKAASVKHFATLNAGEVGVYIRHHLPERSVFGGGGGLLNELDSLEAQEKSLQARVDAGLKTNLQLRHLNVKVYGNVAVVTGYVVGTETSPDGTTGLGDAFESGDTSAWSSQVP